MREGATVETHDNTKGLVRAFDVRTGKHALAVRHHSAARASSATTRGRTSRGRATATSACGRRSPWTKSSASSICRSRRRRPTTTAAIGPGNNLFAESLVCVDLKTGQRKWHFQFVHHPIWNFDMSSAPLLADVTVDGKPRKVVAVPSKQAWLYVFDRVTGEPIWPIEEKPVPQATCRASGMRRRSRIRRRALRYARNWLKLPDDLIDFTPQLRAEALERLQALQVGTESPFTPPILGDVNGMLGAIVAGTATNWPGGGYDPELHIAFAPAGNMPGTAIDRRAAAGILRHPLRLGRRRAAVPRSARTWRLLRRRFAAHGRTRARGESHAAGRPAADRRQRRQLRSG